MQLMENIALAIEGLKANKMRAILTMLGIIIGIGSVIGIVTVGNSLTGSVTASMEEMGATNIMVGVRQKDAEFEMGPGENTLGDVGLIEEDLISDEMIDQFLLHYGNDVQAISLSSALGMGKVQEGRKYANISLQGVNEDYKLANNVKLTEGRFIKAADLNSNRYAAVVSDRMVAAMFEEGENPLGKEIKVNYDNDIQTFTIVGVYEYKESGLMMSTSAEKDVQTALYIPITTSQMIAAQDKGYKSITVMAASSKDATVFSEEIESFFNKYYVNNTRFEVGAISMESIMVSMSSILGTLSIAVAVIAAISLLVGGIGVMNIMLVSVTERTREIGTRKALGARNTAIRIQFIVEAVIICLIGGALGVLLGLGIGYFGSSLLGYPAAPDFLIIVAAVLFSMMIGIFFGYYPANKASRLDPIEALRYE